MVLVLVLLTKSHDPASSPQPGSAEVLLSDYDPEPLSEVSGCPRFSPGSEHAKVVEGLGRTEQGLHRI